MQKIDRLGWAAGLSFTAYGLRVGIRTNTPDILDRITPLLPPGWEPADSPFVHYLLSLRVGGSNPRSKARNYTLLYGGLTQLARTMDVDEALDDLERDLHYYLAERSPTHAFVHAGVVGVRGRAIVLPGSSYAGKSTLVQALLRAGASYYSDEYAVLDERGYVTPLPRRLSLRQEGDQPTRRCHAEELGSHTATEAIPVGLVALSRYRAGSRWHPRALSSGKAVLELVKHSTTALLRPELTLTALHKLVTQATCVTGPRGEADEAAQELLARVA